MPQLNAEDRRMMRACADALVEREVPLHEALSCLREEIVDSAIASEDGNQTRAAERIMTHRNTLLRVRKEMREARRGAQK